LLVLILGAGGLYLWKPEIFRGKPSTHPGGQQQHPPKNSEQNNTQAQQPSGLGSAAAVMPRIIKNADQSFAYKVDFENDYSAFEVDPTLAKAGDGMDRKDDGTKANHVLRLGKIRPMGEPAAGSMVRLILPPDLQLTGKATVRFKICVIKTSDANPEIHVQWDHLREGAGARALATWTRRLGGKDAWEDVVLTLENAQSRLKSRVTPDKPQFIAIYGAKPDEGADVFIDEFELSDVPAVAAPAPPAAAQEAPIAPPPSKKETPIAPPPAKKEPPVAPPPTAPKGDGAGDALNRAL